MIVKCINASYSNNRLQKDKEYLVRKSSINPNGKTIYWLDGIKTGFYSERFQVVSGNQLPTMQKSNAVDLKDVDEERCWEMLKAYKGPGECACRVGILKEKCKFHKDDK